MLDRAREQRFLGRILPGMDVCDVTGDKVGLIAQVHRVSELPDPADVIGADEVMEVRTGFFGLGRRLYIPLGDVQEVLRDSVFLSGSKDNFEARGYYARPAYVS